MLFKINIILNKYFLNTINSTYFVFILNLFLTISTLSFIKFVIIIVNFFLMCPFKFNYLNADILVFFYIFECFILIFSVLFINFIGTKGFFLINIINSFCLFVSFFFFFYKFNILNHSIVFNLGSIFKFTTNEVLSITLLIDSISYNFCFLTITIAMFVYLYAYSYMRLELNMINFFLLLKAFVLSMLLLILAGNWITLLLGWELIGVTSFLLINFWNTKISTLKSAFKAFSFNKLSDCSLFICFLLVQYYFNSFLFGFNITNYIFLYKQIYLFNNFVSYSEVLFFFLMIASFCKSAQFGFHFWLPDSMEAPVPASALIHSATLVSAGIYLVIRFNYLFALAPICSNIFIIITSFTALFGALVASFQTDLKKILAYSTISHCGFLMLSIYFTNIYITLIYLFGHGFYKSISFMCVGNIIQHNSNYQDFRKSGAFLQKIVFESFILFICIFNLSGFPFFLNFFIKHFLLLNLNNLNMYSFFAFVNIYLAAFLGIFYSCRLYYNVFLNFKKNNYFFYKINVLERNYKNFILYTKSNLLGIYAILFLFSFNLIIFFIFLSFFFDQIESFLNFSVFFKNYIFNNLNFFFLKIFFFFLFVLIIWLFLQLKKKNKIEVQYLWIFFIFVIFINIF